MHEKTTSAGNNETVVLLNFLEVTDPEELKTRILEKTKEVLPDESDFQLVERAIAFAYIKHGHRKQRNGKPEIAHIMHAMLLAATYEKNISSELLITLALHDTVEDTGTAIEEIHENFGPQIAENVRQLSKNYFDNEDEYRANLITASFTVQNAKAYDKSSNLNTFYHDMLGETTEKKSKVKKRVKGKISESENFLNTASISPQAKRVLSSMSTTLREAYRQTQQHIRRVR